ncbi:MAG: thiamine pyrophosphate-binding protein [Thermodesulfobacteriota bacterium]|jgi:acetolactate synthase-1/2/3 large subunit
MAKMTGGQIVADCFEKLGIEYYFGYNGHGIWNILNALIDKPHIKGIQPKHEVSAVHMADGYFRAKHKVAPVMASVGPGVLNLVSPIGNAMLDSSGVLLIPTGPPTHYLDRSSLEELSVHAGDDIPSIFRPITKRVWYAMRPDILAYQIMQAYKLAGTGRPGPTAVYIPFDVSSHELEMDSTSTWGKDHLSTKMGGDPEMIREAAGLLSKAQKPLLLVGGGVHIAEAWNEVKAFVDQLQIPVVTSMPGKGVLAEDHPLCLGPVGRSGWGSSVNATKEADAVLAVGCRFSDAHTSGWRKGVVYNFPETKLIQVNIDQLDIGRSYLADVGIVADAKIALQQILEAVKPDWKRQEKNRQPWVAKTKKWKEEWMARIGADNNKGEEDPVSTNRLAYEVNQALPKDANVVTDTGDIQQAYEGYGVIHTPNTFFNNSGMAQMGWATSAVMGVKLARPDKVALSIVGDGSFIMSNYALATAVEYKIPVIWVVINNYGQSIERHGQLINYGREVWSTFERDGKPYNPDFVKMADAYGVKAKKIHSSSQIKGAIQEAIRANEPYMIEVVTDRNSPTYFSPGVTRGYPIRWDKLAYLKQ